MAKVLWTSGDIALATGGTASGAFDVYGLSIDTRSLEPGDLFVALKDQRDGHDFLDAAYAAGAPGALVSRPDGKNRPAITVEDVLPALRDLAVAARARSSAVRCAITGSVGKTSVKDMVAQIFRAAGPAHWAERSFNNHWGVPLTLARMPEDTARAVFEIGMSTPGEIAPRSRLVRPHHAVITKIAPAHLEGLGSIEAIADEKSDIYAGLEAGGSIIVPDDDPFRDHLAARGRSYCSTGEVLGFGTQQTAYAQLLSYESDGLESTASVSVRGQTVRLVLSAVGEHWAMNAAAAMLVAERSGIAPADAAASLEGFRPPAGRGTAETLHLPDGSEALLIDDAYNANPESMRAALAALAARPGQRKLVALGEMLEIGPTSADAHAGLAGAVTVSGAEIAFLAGDGMKALQSALPAGMDHQWAERAAGLTETVKYTLLGGDTLLIKGSNASGMRGLAEELRQWSRNNAGVMDAGQKEPPGV